MPSEIVIDERETAILSTGEPVIIIDGPIVIQEGGGGAGDVTGPASSTDNAPAIFDGVTGKLIKEPNAAVDFRAQAVTNVGTVDGRDVSADGVVLDAHVASVTNPHSVTAAQVGAAVAQWNADKLQGRDVGAAAPSPSDVLTWSGSAWAPAAPSGGVTGPGSSTDNALARWDGAGGGQIQDSGVIVDDSDNLTIPNPAALKIDTHAKIDSVDVARLRFTNGAGTTGFIMRLDGFDNTLYLFNRANNNFGDLRCGDVDAFGDVQVGQTAMLFWPSRSEIKSPSDGVITFTGSVAAFNRLQLGGTSASFPAIKANGTKIEARTASDSGRVNVQASEFEASGGIGFFSQTPPASRPVITGSRSGATVSVLTQLLTALGAAGIIDDQTTA
jgi:hypothetical protein